MLCSGDLCRTWPSIGRRVWKSLRHFYVSYFMEGPVGHTFVSFIFDNAPPLSISIETRPEVGEGLRL
jgi:hypothetical protein